VTEAQGRVTIIDCVFGQVTKIMKGMRDAQVAWACLNLLLIYAPARWIIVAYTVPHGDLVQSQSTIREPFGVIRNHILNGNPPNLVDSSQKKDF
jgi:hypothetical protein